MKLLVLGGTRFVGRAVVEAAIARGDVITVVTRGASGEPPAGVTWQRIDRFDAEAMRPLADEQWDAVVDTWSDDPAAVRLSTSLLAECAVWYGYVSSRSVYAWPPAPGSDESAPVVGAADDFGYAANKRGGELAVLDRFAGRSVIARAGLILGPYEDAGRLTWWLQRADSGGSLIAPEPADQVWQYVDARDIAAFLLNAAAQGRGGTFNVVCPRSDRVTTRRLVESCVEVTGSKATPLWVGPELLERCGVEAWDDLPGWVPPGSEGVGLHDCDVSAALAAGLVCRRIEETVRDTWAWMASLPPRERRPVKSGQPRRGLSAAQEQSIHWLTSAPASQHIK